MTDAQLEVMVAVVGGIFTAGGILTWARMSIAALRKEFESSKLAAEHDLKVARTELYRDVNGLGNRVRVNEDAAARRYHNISLAIIHAAPPNKETELCDLLHENS